MQKFYECGGCGSYHRLGWGGDCRDDTQRFDGDDLDAIGREDVDWELVPEGYWIYALREGEDGPVASCLTYDEGMAWIAEHAHEYPDAEELYLERFDEC